MKLRIFKRDEFKTGGKNRNKKNYIYMCTYKTKKEKKWLVVVCACMRVCVMHHTVVWN